MFYHLFRQSYLIVKRRFEIGNAKRISQEILPEGITKTTYAYSGDGDKYHQFNLYKVTNAQSTEPFPLIIDIHGGGWISGDKDTNNGFNYHLALGGYHVSSLSYRTVDCCTIREQIKDIFDYFHFLHDNRNELGICFDHVVLMGDSAGAQLALLAYCINQSNSLQKIFSVSPVNIIVKCMVLNHSVCYLDLAGKLPHSPLLSKFIVIPEMQRMIYGRNFMEDEAYLSSFNPTKYIHKETHLPPILLITSKGDVTCSFQTFKLHDHLKETGKNCELYFEESRQAKHVFNIAAPDSPKGRKCNDHILNFCRRFI